MCTFACVCMCVIIIIMNFYIAPLLIRAHSASQSNKKQHKNTSIFTFKHIEVEQYQCAHTHTNKRDRSGVETDLQKKFLEKVCFKSRSKSSISFSSPDRVWERVPYNRGRVRKRSLSISFCGNAWPRECEGVR